MISVIIPCHNDHAGLPKALASLALQTGDWPREVVVVDDASDSGIEPIAHQYGARYLRGEWHNANAARNAGLAAAQGDYVVFFDADNIFCPNFLNSLLPPLIADQADVTYGRSILVGTTVYTPYNRLPTRFEDLKMGGSIDTACAVRRSCLLPNPWDEELERYQDWDFHLTNFERGLRYLFIDEPVFEYLVREKVLQTAPYSETSLRQVRFKHSLDTAGQARQTLIVRFGPDPDTHRLCALEELAGPINLKIIDHTGSADFWETQLLPWLRQHQIQFSGVHVSVHHGPADEAAELEWAELHTTTPQVYTWPEGTPVFKPQWRARHTPPTKKVPATLLLHHVTTKVEVMTWLYLAESSPTDWHEIVLVAASPADRQALAQEEFPPGTTLVGTTNLAQTLNRYAGTTCFVAQADLRPRPGLAIHAAATLVDDPTPVINGTLYGRGGTGIWQGNYSFQTRRREEGPWRPGLLPVVNLQLCLLTLAEPLFDPGLDGNLYRLGLAAALKLHERQQPIHDAPWLWATSRQLKRELTHLAAPPSDWYGGDGPPG